MAIFMGMLVGGVCRLFDLFLLWVVLGVGCKFLFVSVYVGASVVVRIVTVIIIRISNISIVSISLSICYSCTLPYILIIYTLELLQ